MVQTLNNSILQDIPAISKDVLRVCDIGGGNGARIKRILGFLHEKFDLRFKLDFVEQSACCVRAFSSQEINAFAEAQRFETLFEDADLTEGYDLVLLIHSIFAFESEALVDKVLSLPCEDGTIVVVSNAPDSFLAGLKLLVDEDYNDRRFEINYLEARLTEGGVPYRRVPFQTRWALANDVLGENVETILDWLSLGSAASFSSGKRQAIRQYVRDHTTDFVHRTLFSESEVAVVIPGRPQYL